VFGSAYQRRYELTGNQTHLKVFRSFPFVQIVKNRTHYRGINNSIYKVMFPPPTKIGLKTLRKRGRRAGMAEAYQTNIEIMDNIYIMQKLDMNV
jgi:hypothetical protein